MFPPRGDLKRGCGKIETAANKSAVRFPGTRPVPAALFVPLQLRNMRRLHVEVADFGKERIFRGRAHGIRTMRSWRYCIMRIQDAKAWQWVYAHLGLGFGGRRFRCSAAGKDPGRACAAAWLGPQLAVGLHEALA
jgi:hypothetical protein